MNSGFFKTIAGIDRAMGFNGKRKFEYHWHWSGFDSWSLGVHFCLSLPNFELHLPFCFIRIGWKITEK